jgi:hypothetical protein
LPNIDNVCELLAVIESHRLADYGRISNNREAREVTVPRRFLKGRLGLVETARELVKFRGAFEPDI